MTAENGDRVTAWRDNLTTDEQVEVDRVDAMPFRMGLGYLLVRMMRHEAAPGPLPWRSVLLQLLGTGGIVGILKAASEMGFTL